MSAVFWIIAAHALACTGYLALLAALAVGFRPRTVHGGEPLSMAVIIPAHNEEAGIAATVRSVLESDYPSDRIRVWVVADNCSDMTAEKAREAGAIAIERHDPADPGKGQALDWLLKTHSEVLDGADATAFLDADTVPDRRFLAEAAASLSHERVEAVQGYYGVLNPGESWRTGLMACALALAHHLRPAGRERLGGTAGLKGNGMAFRAPLLRRTGWPAKGVVEDLEFSLDLLQWGVPVRYNPRALVLAEMAATSAQAASQRRRWEGGRFALIAHHLPCLLFGTGTPLIGRLDAVMDLVTPPLALLGLELLGLWALSAWAAPGFMALFPTCLAVLAGVVACALLLRKEPVSVWLRLLGAPAYVAWKIWVYAVMAFTRGSGWTRTTRSSELGASKQGRSEP